MRTGAIFARGSCRALAWLLALGAVAVLSVGEAAAQTPDLSKGTLTLDEGESDSSITLTVGDFGDGVDPTDQTVAVSVQSIMGGSFDISAAGTATAFDADDDTMSITVAANATVRLTITANDDDDADDARLVLSFAIGDESDTLILRANDDDTSGVIVSARSLTVREGDTTGMDYNIKLGTAPDEDVMVDVKVTSPVNARIRVAQAADDAATTDVDESMPATSQTLTFTSTTWSTAQVVTVTALNDANTISGSATITNKARSVDADYSGVSGRSVSVRELDSVRTVTLSLSSSSVQEGKEITITATLGNSDPDNESPATLQDDVTVALSQKKGSTAEGKGKDWNVGTLSIKANATAGSATLEALHDADEDDEMLTLTASVDSDSGIFVNPRQEVSLSIMDDDTYTLKADKEEVAEGGEVMLTVEVNPAVAAAAAPTKVMIDLYRASGATVMPAEGQDADADGNAIMDEGEKSAKFTLKTAKDANDSNDEVVVARALVGSAVIGEPVTIMVLDTQASPEYTLSVDPDAIGEADGEASVMVKVMTNKAVTADTTLTLAVDAASTAMDPGDYSIMPAEMMVMVAKGEKMGMTTLMVTPVADGMDEPNETIVLTAWMDDAQVGNAATLTIIDSDSMTFTLSGPSDMNLVEGFEYDIEVMSSTPVKADTTVMLMRGDASTATADEDYMVEDIMIMAGETMGRTKLMVKSDDMADGGSDGSMAEKLVLYGMVGNMRTNELSFYIWDLAVPALPVIAQLLLAALMAVGGYRRYRRR